MISSLGFAAFLASAQMISIDARDLDLGDFFRLIANAANINVVIHPSVQGKVNLAVKEVPWERVLDMVLKSHGLAKEVEGNIMRIVPLANLEAEQKQKAAVEQACINALPLQTHLYVLNYARAEDVSVIISKMLSPRGSVVAYHGRNAVIVRDVESPSACSR